MKKIALAALLAFTLLPAASNAQVYVRVGPPAPIVGTASSAAGAVATCGLAAITAGMELRYVWVPGRWDRPPHPHAVWSFASLGSSGGWLGCLVEVALALIRQPTFAGRARSFEPRSFYWSSLKVNRRQKAATSSLARARRPPAAAISRLQRWLNFDAIAAHQLVAR